MNINNKKQKKRKKKKYIEKLINYKNYKNYKNSKNSKDYKLIPQKVCIIGLIPFAYIALYFRSLTALTVLINGIIFHSRFLDYDIMIIIDTIVNAILIVSYIIISNFDFVISFLTISGSSIFIFLTFISSYFKKNYDLSNYFHVIFVQGFGAIALTKYCIYH
jgi:hypothetical protein|tara:strand:+ start:271 stop:756 length:486 start_codon:yes stop_codon:yes gene_type:complete